MKERRIRPLPGRKERELQIAQSALLAVQQIRAETPQDKLDQIQKSKLRQAKGNIDFIEAIAIKPDTELFFQTFPEVKVHLCDATNKDMYGQESHIAFGYFDGAIHDYNLTYYIGSLFDAFNMHKVTPDLLSELNRGSGLIGRDKPILQAFGVLSLGQILDEFEKTISSKCSPVRRK